MQIPILDRGSDLHVHSTFSDGASTIEENLASATGLGMHTVGMVDHVRRDTTYVPDFEAAVRELARSTDLRIYCGVEAKILDTAGTVDLPASLPALDYVLIADHQMPRPNGPAHPRDVVAAIEDGTVTVPEIIDDLVEATVASLRCYDRTVIAHLFSILPKCGIHEDQVPERLIRRIGDAAKAAGTAIEINEKWTCPSRRVATLLRERGAEITLSTDAHHETRVGRYDYVERVAASLEAPAASGP
ncbi:MAG: PHP domain-containing protein [Actinomycetota bacterium]|nr:PHP domain-containing protein [Actinomycetota bacterium]